MTDVHAVIPVKGNLHLTLRLLKDLRRERPARTTILDNGSPALERRRLAAEIERLPNAAVILRPDATIHEMWNEGLDRSDGMHTAILNNDIRLGRHALRRCADALDRDETLAIVSPRHDGERPTKGIEEVRQIAAAGGLAGFAMMLRAGWDFRFPTELRWWFGDNFALKTAYHEGLRCAIVLDATVTHVGGGSQTGRWAEDPVKRAQIAADRKWFLDKWAEIEG